MQALAESVICNGRQAWREGEGEGLRGRRRGNLAINYAVKTLNVGCKTSE